MNYRQQIVLFVNKTLVDMKYLMNLCKIIHFFISGE